MVTIFYIAPKYESIHINRAPKWVQLRVLAERKWIQSRQSAIPEPRFQARRCVRPASQRGFVGRLVRLVSSLARWIGHLLERRRGRLALLEMTDDQLKDIGISRCDAHREGIRRFWE
jgi:uncharacterized protein YjiS (DUF1127 family)